MSEQTEEQINDGLCLGPPSTATCETTRTCRWLQLRWVYTIKRKKHEVHGSKPESFPVSSSPRALPAAQTPTVHPNELTAVSYKSGVSLARIEGPAASCGKECTPAEERNIHP
eukprot:GHVU01064582.1.p1 GENE.GHVU01064582.1~~GHVU01064582.1.p1  ORF type:complete len:113 (+),score=4.91 GHVU01064582.1:220-558(+)